MTKKDLESTCQNYVCVHLEHAKEAEEALRKNFALENCKIVNQTELHILDTGCSAREVNRYLLLNNYMVDEIYMHRQDLEEYFLGLMGGAANA